ncbi:3-ketoacyl-ACP reductase [Novimethylophilus kurashikiensis]|uniref:3-ketoacyl-ACP reductase n=1 Tax=Novimethylophilus kurashikiensis TaxID=1825523 RepID=A0A2R5FJS3_9PROT|nr:DUF5672 family protein [Novimethylophilus kurashikiensis]GBG15954.1 3-ketoacyl-ACP reductase [Novimethylophilus kurashikiensis]
MEFGHENQLEKKEQVVVLVPLYKAELSDLELFSLDRSLSVLQERSLRFIAPAGLDVSFYQKRYSGVPFEFFESHCFDSIENYNRLLLGRAFYERYLDFEFLLILQTDAIILRDELDFWCASPFDYVGAPWPDGYELFVNAGRFEGNRGKLVRTYVGNGGLSLRRVRKCLSLLEEYKDIIEIFDRTGSSEDLFFAVMGALSGDFVIPNEITASKFSMELKPSYYLAVNGGKLPMGGHAWWKYEPEFWRSLLQEAITA